MCLSLSPSSLYFISQVRCYFIYSYGGRSSGGGGGRRGGRGSGGFGSRDYRKERSSGE